MRIFLLPRKNNQLKTLPLFHKQAQSSWHCKRQTILHKIPQRWPRCCKTYREDAQGAAKNTTKNTAKHTQRIPQRCPGCYMDTADMSVVHTTKRMLKDAACRKVPRICPVQSKWQYATKPPSSPTTKPLNRILQSTKDQNTTLGRR